jgi:hypothetical protein
MLLLLLSSTSLENSIKYLRGSAIAGFLKK